jgi:hypothetical protein
VRLDKTTLQHVYAVLQTHVPGTVGVAQHLMKHLSAFFVADGRNVPWHRVRATLPHT